MRGGDEKDAPTTAAVAEANAESRLKPTTRSPSGQAETRKGGNGEVPGNPPPSATAEVTFNERVRKSLVTWCRRARKIPVPSDGEIRLSFWSHCAKLTAWLKLPDLTGCVQRGGDYFLTLAGGDDIRLSEGEMRSRHRFAEAVSRQAGVYPETIVRPDKSFWNEVYESLWAIMQREPGPTPQERLRDLIGEYLDPDGVSESLDDGLQQKAPVIHQDHLWINVRHMAGELARLHSVALTERDLIDLIREAGGRGPKTLHWGRRHGVFYWCIPSEVYRNAPV